jgi:hypothetical protein
VAELADAHGSGPCSRKGVEVQVLSSAPSLEAGPWMPDRRDAMKVFISYGDTSDQVTALRLQALGAVNGLTVYVPPAFTRQGTPTFLDPEASQKLNEAEVVLGVIGAGLTEACRQELNAGMALRKSMIVMSYPPFALQLQSYFGSNLVVIDPADPGGAEAGIVQHLKTIDAQQSAKKALLALGTLALGLLILAPADPN